MVLRTGNRVRRRAYVVVPTEWIRSLSRPSSSVSSVLVARRLERGMQMAVSAARKREGQADQRVAVSIAGQPLTATRTWRGCQHHCGARTRGHAISENILQKASQRAGRTLRTLPCECNDITNSAQQLSSATLFPFFPHVDVSRHSCTRPAMSAMSGGPYRSS